MSDELDGFLNEAENESDDLIDSEGESLEPVVVIDDSESGSENEASEEGDDGDDGGDDFTGEDESTDDEFLRVMDEEAESDEDIFLDEEPGYREDYNWTTLEEEELDEHIKLLRATEEELAKLNPKRLSVLDRWAAAQAYARVGMRDEFQAACRSIIKSRRRHEGLQYEDIYLELISDLADAKEFEEAFSFLEKFSKAFPDEEDIYFRVRGLLLIESGDIHAGKSQLDELMSKANDAGELHLELGDDLLAMGHLELALRILDRGKDFARRAKDTELMTAIDETRRFAMIQLEGE